KQLFEEVQDTDIDVRLLGLTLTNLDTVNFENMSLPI
ncbi:DNA polymerase IV, partial [Lactobacillus salivarius]|nr:DNA polymerase IV [Ligilactobacillus salivarius]